ncbi:btk-binding protein-related [Anaeramoeba flamelloides]|uniref:Btk-binding protein-related n=1 Tax=Anaeramoeba flamelloides TaxID=1746091 RepID=A0ABQ8XZ06_9EUKA|nr:btk-binding protein-related [Anaeramoeba flamelloides]
MVSNFTPITFFGKFVIRHVEVGSCHSIVLTNDNRIFTWGKNDCGQIGIGNKQDQITPTEIIIKEFRSPDLQLHITAGLHSNHVWFSKLDPISEDFLYLFQKGIFCDSKINEIKVHKLLLEWRIGETIDNIQKVFKKYSNINIKEFLRWVYSDDFNGKEQSVFTDICKDFGIKNPQNSQKSLKRDLKNLVTDEKTKDFTILIKVPLDKLEDNTTENDIQINQKLNGNELKDMLTVEKEIKIHKLILIARSQLYRDMFTNITETINSVHDYSGKSFQTLKIFYKFLYTRKIEFENDDDVDLIINELEDVIDYYQLNSNSYLIKELEKLKKK